VGEDLTREDLLGRIRALLPRLAADAPEAERLRRPTDASIRALEESGVFRMMVPRCHGGLELDLPDFLEVGLLLAEADTSIAWVTCFYIEHNWMLCQFPEALQRELYGGCSFVLAPGAIAPSGEARREKGGFRLRGRWQWGTGVMHASWAIVGAIGDSSAGEPPRFFAVPMADVKVEDTWFVDGMVGTGSNDMVVDDLFVPLERSVSIVDMVGGVAHGASLHAGALYRTPMAPILMTAASMPVVGQARAVVRGFEERLAGHVRFGSSKPQAEKSGARMRLACAAIEVNQAELLLRDVVDDVCARRADARLVDRARWSASITHAIHQARRAIQSVAEGSGASAHFQQHPLQRALRDANVASCHVAFDADAQLELYGRVLLGQDPSSALF